MYSSFSVCRPSFFVLRLCLVVSLLATKNPTASGQNEPCWSEKVARRNAARFPDLVEKRAELSHDIAESARNFQAQATPRSVVSIPVVVHVVYKTNLDNISDGQIQSQIDALNADYRKLNPNAASVPPDFKPFAADMGIEFCLASRTPDGQPTDGITRTQTIFDQIGQDYSPDGKPRICYTALGGADAWDATRYLNIWVGRIGDDILGFATFPGTVPGSEDGVVIDPRYFGTKGLAALYPPHHLGRTATHEVGHFFDLYHVWGGSENVCTDDDGVGDTPVQRGPYEDCPVHPQLSCGNRAMFMNFMDYTDDACMSLFTEGQKARFWGALQMARPGLLSSDGCKTVSANNEISARELALYPNPASEKLAVQIPENEAFVLKNILLANALGQVFQPREIRRNGQSLELDIADLPPGWYFLKIGNRATRFVKI